MAQNVQSSYKQNTIKAEMYNSEWKKETQPSSLARQKQGGREKENSVECYKNKRKTDRRKCNSEHE